MRNFFDQEDSSWEISRAMQFAMPQAIKFQEAPCQMPVTNQVIMLAIYKGTRLPAFLPKSFLAFFDRFPASLLMETGKKMYSLSHRMRDMCHLRQNSARFFEKKG